MKLNFDWKTFSWIRRGHRRTKVLLYLSQAKNPITATEIKKIQKIDITNAAFTLNELWKKGMADCLNPEDHHGKLFRISSKGSEIVKQFK